MKYDVVIIGAGLGGLECGYICAKHGKSVCVLEQGITLGGSLQVFKRKGHTFDTGYHYIGAYDNGQSLHRLFDYFNLTHLSFQKMDSDYFDEVVYKGKSYRFANGYDNFVDALAEEFPHQRQNLKKYVDFLSKVGDNIFNQFSPKDLDSFYTASLFGQSAYDFLKETFTDEDLINVISGTSLKLELKKETLPLYTFAQINDSFIRSAYRLKGGGGQIADSLAADIEKMGGIVKKNAKVDELVEVDGRIAYARLANGEEIQGETFISSAHPAATLDLVKESSKIRKIYRNRITRLQNTTGMFTANIKLKKDTLPYLNRNQYFYDTDDVWNVCDGDDSQIKGALMSYQVPENGEKYAENVDIIIPMSWAAVEQWDGTKVMQRGEEYNAMKNKKAEECVDFVSKYVPQLKNAVDTIYTSTPLTYKDYVSTVEGSAYGIRKDYNNVMQTLLTPRTPIENLLLTGQSLNLHGILGVSMTSLFTTAEIVGMDTVKEDLKL